MGGSRQTQTTDARHDPWAPAQPVLQDVLNNAQKYGNDPSRFEQTFGQNTRDAAAGMANLGRNPLAQQGALGGLIDGTKAGYGVANQQLMDTASGGMLGGNPYLDKVLATSSQRAADTVNQQFAGVGRHGSGAHTGVLGDRLGAIETNARMQNYNTERGNQLNAAGILNANGQNIGQYAGQLDGANIQQQQLLAQGGAMQDQFDNAKRTAPLAATQWQAGLATPIAGLGGTNSSTQTTATPANKGGMIAGAAMAGLGAATGNPMMMMNGVSSGLGAASGGPMSMPVGGGGGQSGTPFFGAFGRPAQSVYSDPGTASNGGWSTSASSAPTGMFGNSWFGGNGGG